MTGIANAKLLIDSTAALASVGLLAAENGFDFSDLRFAPEALSRLNALRALDVPQLVEEVKPGELDELERAELEQHFDAHLVLPGGKKTLEEKMEAVFGLALRWYAVAQHVIALAYETKALLVPNSLVALQATAWSVEIAEQKAA